MDAPQSPECVSCRVGPVALERSLGFVGCSTDSVLDFLGTSSVTFAQKWDLAYPLPEALRTTLVL